MKILNALSKRTGKCLNIFGKCRPFADELTSHISTDKKYNQTAVRC